MRMVSAALRKPTAIAGTQYIAIASDQVFGFGSKIGMVSNSDTDAIRISSPSQNEGSDNPLRLTIREGYNRAACPDGPR